MTQYTIFVRTVSDIHPILRLPLSLDTVRSPISHAHFFSELSKDSHSSPFRSRYGCLRELEVWPKLCLRTLLCSVQVRVILCRDISRVYNIHYHVIVDPVKSEFDFDMSTYVNTQCEKNPCNIIICEVPMDSVFYLFCFLNFYPFRRSINIIIGMFKVYVDSFPVQTGPVCVWDK